MASATTIISNMAAASSATPTTLFSATALATSTIARGGGGGGGGKEITLPPLLASVPKRIETFLRNINSSNKKAPPTKKLAGIIDLKQWNDAWYQIPEVARFFVSGNLGNMCFFAIERAIHNYITAQELQQPQSPLPPFVGANADSISFFLGYILQMGTQHLLHAWLVYGLKSINTREKYLKTLAGQSSAYFTAMIGSTILNSILRNRFGVSKNTAFFITLYLFAIINYFVVGWIVRRAVIKADEHQLELLLKGGKNKIKPLQQMRGGAAFANDNNNILNSAYFASTCSMRQFIMATSKPVHNSNTNTNIVSIPSASKGSLNEILLTKRM